MSKIKKLVNNPSLFFRDYFNKRLGNSNKDNSSPVVKKTKPVVKKVVKPISKVAEKKVLNISISNVNFYQKIPLILQSGEGAKGGENHLRLWLPTFMQTGLNFLVLVRNEELYNWVKKEYPWLSVAFAKRLIDVEEIISLLPDAKYVFYPSSTGNNIHITRFNHLQHVFIGHGDSDKAASAHKALRLYDEIWTAGQAHIDRFINSNFNTAHLLFLKVGRPNLKNILQVGQKKWADRMEPRVLYLPTWEGVMEEANYSSTCISGQIIRGIADKFSIPSSVKFHPFTGNRNATLNNINQITMKMVDQEGIDCSVISSSIGIDQLIPAHNIFICDISAVVSECLTANSPIFVYIPDNKELKVSSSNMVYEDYCYTFSNVDELLTKMSSVLSGDDYLLDNRKRAVDYFIGLNETLEQRFVKQLKSISDDNGLAYQPKLFDKLLK